MHGQLGWISACGSSFEQGLGKHRTSLDLARFTRGNAQSARRSNLPAIVGQLTSFCLKQPQGRRHHTPMGGCQAQPQPQMLHSRGLARKELLHTLTEQLERETAMREARRVASPRGWGVVCVWMRGVRPWAPSSGVRTLSSASRLADRCPTRRTPRRDGRQKLRPKIGARRSDGEARPFWRPRLWRRELGFASPARPPEPNMAQDGGQMGQMGPLVCVCRCVCQKARLELSMCASDASIAFFSARLSVFPLSCLLLPSCASCCRFSSQLPSSPTATRPRPARRVCSRDTTRRVLVEARTRPGRRSGIFCGTNVWATDSPPCCLRGACSRQHRLRARICDRTL